MYNNKRGYQKWRDPHWIHVISFQVASQKKVEKDFPTVTMICKLEEIQKHLEFVQTAASAALVSVTKKQFCN